MCSSYPVFNSKPSSTFRAHIALALNVTQNHLDRHHTFENYAAAKGRIFENQRPEDHAILNADDAVCVGYAQPDRRRPSIGSAAAGSDRPALFCAAKN